jgi:hypothetical protein
MKSEWNGFVVRYGFIWLRDHCHSAITVMSVFLYKWRRIAWISDPLFSFQKRIRHIGFFTPLLVYSKESNRISDVHALSGAEIGLNLNSQEERQTRCSFFWDMLLSEVVNWQVTASCVINKWMSVKHWRDDSDNENPDYWRKTCPSAICPPHRMMRNRIRAFKLGSQRLTL